MRPLVDREEIDHRAGATNREFWSVTDATFILQDFAGQGPVSREYCWAIIGPDSTRCDGYPTEAEIAAAAGGG
jgi:hypothetical protein